MKIYIIILSIIFVGILALSAQAADNQTIYISEIKTEFEHSASAEYIELHNPNLSEVNIEGWKIQYKSATGENWVNKYELSGIFKSRSNILLATAEANIENSNEFSGGLASSGGHLRIIDSQGKNVDSIGWGLADSPNVQSVESHLENQSIKLKFNEDGIAEKVSNDSIDYFISDNPNPINDFQESAKVVVRPPKPNTKDRVEEVKNTETESIKNYLPVKLITIYPNTKSPEQDSEDEFIEIQNPNSRQLNLDGYLIEAGANWRYDYGFDGKVLEPGKSLKIYSEESGIALSNSGTGVRILDPNGKIVDGMFYEKAPDGEVLKLVNGEWKWSGDLENSSDNNNDQDFEYVLASTDSNDDKDTEQRNEYQTPESLQEQQLNKTILVVVGSLAILYAVYEYRADIRNRIIQIRRYFANWRANRAKY